MKLTEHNGEEGGLAMKEDYLITIHGTMEQNGGSDSVQLMTRGSFVKRGGSFFITYKRDADYRL